MSCSDCTPITFVYGHEVVDSNLPIKSHTCLTTAELTDAQLVRALHLRGLLVDVHAEDYVSSEMLDRHKDTGGFEEHIRLRLGSVIGRELVHAGMTKETRQSNRKHYPDTAIKHTLTVLKVKDDRS